MGIRILDAPRPVGCCTQIYRSNLLWITLLAGTIITLICGNLLLSGGARIGAIVAGSLALLTVIILWSIKLCNDWSNSYFEEMRQMQIEEYAEPAPFWQAINDPQESYLSRALHFAPQLATLKNDNNQTPLEVAIHVSNVSAVKALLAMPTAPKEHATLAPLLYKIADNITPENFSKQLEIIKLIRQKCDTLTLPQLNQSIKGELLKIYQELK